jgi:alpha-L-fucosidase
LDIERGLTGEPLPQPWQSDTSLGDWFYNVKDVYKTAGEIADTLVDIVSKNGNLLLNLPQKPDGTIDDETHYTLKKLGVWLKNNGEGIFGSRPYSVYREGKTELASGAFMEEKVDWQSTDYRFTRKDNAIYAYMMRTGSEDHAVIYSLGRLYENEIKSVDVSGRPTVFEQKDGALLVRIPSGLDTGMPACIKIMVDK